MNHDLKLIALHDKLEGDIQALEGRVEAVKTISGRDGKEGSKGATGATGKPGKDGRDGKDGKDGRDGADGDDGVSIVDVNVDFDNHLRVELSNGDTIDAGEIQSTDDGKGTQIIGFGNGRKEGDRELYIQDTQPIAHEPYLWVQTNANDTPEDFSLWYYTPH